MKYVVLKVDAPIERRFPVIFLNFMVHADVAFSFRESLARHLKIDESLIAIASAGELNLVLNEVRCSGKSETLGVESREDDGRLIQMYDYLGGL